MRLLLFSIMAIFLVACGWERKIRFDLTPDDVSIEINQPFPANGWGLQVLLTKGARRKVLYKLRGDVFLDFADVTSSKQGTVVIFTCGTPALRLAYDLKRDDFISFSGVRQISAAHIRQVYMPVLGSPLDEKTFEWACSQEGNLAFRRRYPGSRPR